MYPFDTWVKKDGYFEMKNVKSTKKIYFLT